jgi:hypothetical protein
MIREGHKLPEDVTDRIPVLIGILVSGKLDKQKRFDKHIELIGKFNEVLKTDEVDLVMMNDAPMRFAYNIIKSGKLIHCGDSTELTDFIEKTVKLYLDFRFFRDAFDDTFLKGIGYSG